MTSKDRIPISSKNESRDRLPMAGLLALSMACFIAILTEALPAGLLPQMSADLGVSQALGGQLVTVFAVGCIVAAIPLTTLTQGWRRRTLLIFAVVGFAVVNTITAISSNYVLTLAARLFAGIFAGLLWALVAAYAARMVADHLKGRAIAVAMVGVPIALSLGIPAGTSVGAILGWRATFGIISALAVLMVGWILVKVPDYPGQAAGERLPLAKVFFLPGIRSVLVVTLTFILAHTILYTYIAPFLVPSGLVEQVDVVLLVFGIASLLGIWIVGVLIDRWLRELVLVNIALFMLATLSLALWGSSPTVIYGAMCVWGVAFGGAATLFQTASAKTAVDAVDVAQSMLVTMWNIAIASGSMVGGILLETRGVTSFPWVLLSMLSVTLVVVWRAKTHGFPSVAKSALRAGELGL